MIKKSLIYMSLSLPVFSLTPNNAQARSGDINLTCGGTKFALVVGDNSLVCKDDRSGKYYFVDIYSVGISGGAAVEVLGISCSARRPDRQWESAWTHWSLRNPDDREFYGRTYYDVIAERKA